MRYGYETHLEGLSFGDAVTAVTDVLGDEGFEVLSEIDVQAILRERLGVDFRPYVILGACNTKLMHQAIVREPDLGLLLPYNVVVQERPEDGVAVSFTDPRVMLSLVDNPEVVSVADEMHRKLRRAIVALER